MFTTAGYTPELSDVGVCGVPLRYRHFHTRECKPTHFSRLITVPHLDPKTVGLKYRSSQVPFSFTYRSTVFTISFIICFTEHDTHGYLLHRVQRVRHIPVFGALHIYLLSVSIHIFCFYFPKINTYLNSLLTLSNKMYDRGKNWNVIT